MVSGKNTLDISKTVKSISDFAFCKNDLNFGFESSVHHDLYDYRAKLLTHYRDALKDKDLSEEDKEKYLNLLVNEMSANEKQRQDTTERVRLNRNENFFAGILISAGIIVSQVMIAQTLQKKA